MLGQETWMKMADPKIDPNHYKVGIETFDYIQSWHMGFAEGNIIKYVTRYKLKNEKEDLLKAKWYLDKLIGKI